MQILLIKKNPSAPLRVAPFPGGSRDAQNGAEILATWERPCWSGECPRQAQGCCPRGGLEGRAGKGARGRGGGATSQLRFRRTGGGVAAPLKKQPGRKEGAREGREQLEEEQ